MSTDKENSASSHERLLVWMVVLIGAAFGYALVATQPRLISDEGYHALQVWSWYTGENEMLYNVTVPPTYHAIMGFILRQIGAYHDYLLRFITLLIGLLALPAAYGLTAHFYPREASLRTLQFFFLPILFPLFFLVYTDVWTLAAIATMTLLALKRRFVLAAGFAALAVALRQTAILWVGFAWLLICFDRIDSVRLAHWSQLLRNLVVKGFFFFFVFAGFAAFVYFNGGIAIGDQAAHQAGVNLSNLYVFLATAWVLLLPLTIQSGPAIAKLLRKPWVLALLAGGFLLYLGTFKPVHSYNNIDFFLRNQLLIALRESLVLRVFFFIPVAWMALTLAVLRLPERRLYWLYLLIPMSLLPHPVVEQRYFYPALMLLMAWRPPCRPGVEAATLAGYVILAAGLHWGIVTERFFL